MEATALLNTFYKSSSLHPLEIAFKSIYLVTREWLAQEKRKLHFLIGATASSKWRLKQMRARIKCVLNCRTKEAVEKPCHCLAEVCYLATTSIYYSRTSINTQTKLILFHSSLFFSLAGENHGCHQVRASYTVGSVNNSLKVPGF